MNQEEILKELDAKISQNPNDVEALGQRGMLYFELKKYKESLEDLDKAIEGGSLNPKFFSCRGRVKMIYDPLDEDTGTEEKSIAQVFEREKIFKKSIRPDFERAVELGENTAEAYYKLACLYMYPYVRLMTMPSREDLLKTIEYTNQAIQLKPNYLEAIELRADSYIGLAEDFKEKLRDEQKEELYKKALLDIQILIDNNSDLSSNYYSKGVILSKFNKIEDTYVALNKAIELADNDVPMYFYLERGILNNKLHKYSNAVTDFSKFFENPDSGLIDNFAHFWTAFVDSDDIQEMKKNTLFAESQIALFYANEFETLLILQDNLIEAERAIDYLLRAKAKSKLNDFVGSLEAFVEHEIINNGKEKYFIEEYKEAFENTNFNKIAQSKTERLIIREFGPVQDIDIEIKPVTVIIGSTGSGKSTIIKLLHIFRQLFLESDLTTQKFIEAVTDKFKLVEPIKETYIKYILGDFFIEYTEGGLNTNFSTDFLDEYQKLKDLSEKPLKGKGNFPLLKSWFEVAALMIHRPLYVPVERTFVTSYMSNSAAYQRSKIQIADFILQFIENKQLANNTVKKMDLPFLKATYFFRNNNDIIEHYGSDKLAIGLEYASSGFQAIVPLLLVFEYFSKAKDPFSYFFAVEEPELNLFPTVQKKLVEQMISKTVHNNCRLIMATHSPYILSYLNNLLFAWKVGQIQPEAENKIAIEFRLNPENFGAYALSDGQSQSIFDRKTGLIDHNYLDEVFEEIGFEYDALYDVYADFISSNGNH